MVKDNKSPDREGGSLLGSQRGGLKGAAAKKGACVLDLPRDLETVGQKSSAPKGTSSKRKGGQAGTAELTESFEGRQANTGQVSGIGH